MSQPPEQPYYPQPQDPQHRHQQPEYQPGHQPPQQPGYHQPGYPPPQQPGYQPPEYQPGYQPPQQPGYQQPQQPYYQQGAPSQYPQSGYPQSEYGQGYPQSGPPAPPQPPKKKSGAGKIVLIVLGVLVVLCGGGAVVAYVALKDDVKDVVDAANTRVVAPETLGGKPKITNPELDQVVTEMVDGMKQDMTNETGAVGGLYGDLAKQDITMIAAASGRIADPNKEVADAFTEIAGSGMGVNPATDVEPGPLGGHAKCADGTAQDTPVAICAWADAGSVGIVFTYFKTVDQVKANFVAIRGEIEQRD
jgi:hypothetical protein